MASEQERKAHVVRRLGIGANPDVVAGITDIPTFIDAQLANRGASPIPSALTALPANISAGKAYEPAWRWWLAQMATNPRLLEERLTWFWHDHFATALSALPGSWLLMKQQALLRQNAMGNFATMLRSIARDPAMLAYLDGEWSTFRRVNENYARELCELHTIGVGRYTQADVVAAAKANTGWRINRTGVVDHGVAPFCAYYDTNLHVAGTQMFLGRSVSNIDDVISVLLDSPYTGRRIAAKLYRRLVGLYAGDETANALGDLFRGSGYDIMTLVRAIVTSPAFTSDQAIRMQVRTPVEKLVTVLQALRQSDVTKLGGIGNYQTWFKDMDYRPFFPPNPAGYPKKRELLLSTASIMNTLHLVKLTAAGIPGTATEVLNRLGLYDVDPSTAAAVGAQLSALGRMAMAVGSPEFQLS
ncbi:MAG: hypothetical protein QOH10_1749 [Actinomycetota bacterium]|nr:hypothetical protein [Actinomycetota bacterium]